MTTTIPWNDTDADDADIRPIYDEEPMTEVQLTAECNIFAIGQQHTEQPEIINEGGVDQAQVDQESQIKMIQVKEMMQDNDLKNSKSKDKGSRSRSQSMNEQSHYKQDKTKTRQSINVKSHIFNVIGSTEEFEERDLNIGGDQAPGDLRETLQPNLTHHDGESPQRKAQGVQTRLTYGESSHQNSRTREETQFSESESCDRRRRPKKRKPSPATTPRDTHPLQNTSVFSRLRREKDKLTRQRIIPVSTTVFTRPGHRDGNVFTCLRERRKNVHSRLGPEVAPRSRHASERRSAFRTEIEEEWYAADRANPRQLARTKEAYLSEDENNQGGHWKSRPKKRRSNGEDDMSQPWLCEETDPFTARIRYFEVPKKTRIPTNVKTYDGTGLPPESIDNNEMLRKAFLGNFSQQKKYIKDPVEIHHIKQREGDSTKDFMERFKAESMHVNGAPECMRTSEFMHGITNPDLIKKQNDNIPKSVDEMMNVTTAFLRGEVAATN
ncbi:hypothetical protein Tco_1230074 [Tanacetum coccineum]